MSELLPCPFCGYKPAIATNAVPIKVLCQTKDCPLGDSRKMQDGLGRGVFDYKAKYFEIADWNTRYETAKVPDQPDDMPANINTMVKIKVEKAMRLDTINILAQPKNVTNMEIENNIYLEPGNYGFRFCVVNYAKASLPERESDNMIGYDGLTWWDKKNP